MAENLTVPADYGKPTGKAMDLLPPSAFESKPKQSDPWTEIAKATEEVVKLKLENTKLKEAQNAQALHTENAQKIQMEHHHHPPPDVCKYRSDKQDLKYVDELITKQATEITELKGELRTLKCKHKEEVTEIERELNLKEKEYSHRIASLEGELKAAESRYDSQVGRLSQEHQRETEELNEVAEKLQDEVNCLRVRTGERLEDAEEKYTQLHQTSTERIKALTLELRSKSALVETQSKQMAQLKKYIGETENLPKPADILRKEKESLTVKVKDYESERESLNSTIQLLNIRLNSMTEIMRLQEKELNQSSTDIVNPKLEHILLTRWREKVFALMVQQKSADISSKKDEANWKAKVQDVERQLSTCRNQVHQLSHSLSDREAQLSMEKNTVKKLQTELSEAQQLAVCLDDRIQGNVHNSQELQHLAASVSSKFDTTLEQFNTAFSAIKAYGQRISFASGRVEMLQGLFARREAMLKLQLENGIPEREVPQSLQVDSVGEDESYLKTELERVMKERDNLAAQIREDAQLLDNKVASVYSQVEEEMSTLRQAKDDLEAIVQEKMHACSELSEKLEYCEKDLEFSNQTVDELKDTLARQEQKIDQLVAEQRREIERQNADSLAEKDRQLNDAKREQAKAVVSLRQLERQTARDKERASEHLSTVEEHYTRQLTSLQEQLRTLEKERNLMMATLRQEGLIGRVKSEREGPVRRSWDTDDEPVKETVEQRVEPGVTSQEGDGENVAETEEPLTTVLEDLQSLTTAVLADDQSDTNSEDES